jgi:serine/threonine protein kinase
MREHSPMVEYEIFLAAMDIEDPDQQSAYLEQACTGNAALRKNVEKLLAAHDRSGDFLDVPVLQQMTDNSHGPTTICGRDGIDLSFLEPSETPESLGRLLHYDVREVIGRGGFGIVLKAFDTRLERVVAIKVMLPQIAATSPARKRFLREARATAAVRHENVIHINAVDEQPFPFFVMEYIDGETLQQRLDRTGPLDVPDVLRFGQKIASGLAAAHDKGLIHRDIKPGNILFENCSETIKLTDFGLARSIDDASMTQSGVISGTPLYMSPEQAKGATLDHRSDLFSLGSVLYQMVSGRPPFRAPSIVAVLKRVCEDNPRRLADVLPGTPGWLETIISRLLEKDPADRYQTAREVAELLGRCQQELELQDRVTCSDQLAATIINRKRQNNPTIAQALRSKTHWLAGILVIGFGIAIAIPVVFSRKTSESDARVVQLADSYPVKVEGTVPPDSDGRSLAETDGAAPEDTDDMANREEDLATPAARLDPADAEKKETITEARISRNEDPLLGNWREVVGKGENQHFFNVEFRSGGVVARALSRSQKETRRRNLVPAPNNIAGRGRWETLAEGSYRITYGNGATGEITLAGDRYWGHTAGGVPMFGMRQVTDTN